MRALTLAITATILVAIVVLATLNPSTVANRIAFLHLLVLFCTLLGLLWYADETKKLRVQIVNQNVHERTPFLRLQFDGVIDSGCKEKVTQHVDVEKCKIVFTIVNDGRGLAQDVVFDPIELRTIPSLSDLVIKVKARPVISSRGSSGISEYEIKDESMHELWESDNLAFNLTNQIKTRLTDGFRVRATYTDILKKDRYEAIFVADPTYNDSFRIERQEKLASNGS